MIVMTPCVIVVMKLVFRLGELLAKLVRIASSSSATFAQSAARSTPTKKKSMSPATLLNGWAAAPPAITTPSIGSICMISGNTPKKALLYPSWVKGSAALMLVSHCDGANIGLPHW